MSKKYHFEILIIDPNGKSEISSPKSLIHGLLSTEKLWDKAEFENKDQTYLITDDDLTIEIKPVDTASSLYDLIEAGFLIKCYSSNFDRLEGIRQPFLIHLKSRLQFEHIRILTDDISTKISNQTYPLINELENLLRRYIAKFFTQKVGVNWWLKTVPDKVDKKTKMRKDNETVFSNLVETDLTLIDFDDLGEIIYKHKLGFNRPENLYDSVLELESMEDVNKLKSNLDSNYNRFFKENFKDLGFDKKWKTLFKIRNKVAHNNLFISQDLQETQDLYKGLKEIILNAEQRIDAFKFSLGEQVAIRESISEEQNEEQNIDKADEVGVKVVGKIDLPDNEYENSVYKNISEKDFLNELDYAENTLARNNLEYVGLKAFITKILGNKGYAFGSSYSLANILKEQGVVEIYDIEDPYSYWPVKAIKRIK